MSMVSVWTETDVTTNEQLGVGLSQTLDDDDHRILCSIRVCTAAILRPNTESKLRDFKTDA